MERSEATSVTAVRDRRALPAVERTVKRRRPLQLGREASDPEVGSAAWGDSVGVSRQYGIGRSLIHNWRRQEAVSVLATTVRFTPVALGPERPAASADGTIEIELDGGRVLARRPTSKR